MCDRWNVRVHQIEIGKLTRDAVRIGEARIRIVRRDARHRDRAFRERRGAGAGNVIGGHHGLFAADENPQAEIVTFGALGFLDRAVAHFDRNRYGAHRDRVGCVRAGLARGADQAFGKLCEGGLIEEGFHSGHFPAEGCSGSPQKMRSNQSVCAWI